MLRSAPAYAYPVFSSRSLRGIAILLCLLLSGSVLADKTARVEVQGISVASSNEALLRISGELEAVRSAVIAAEQAGIVDSLSAEAGDQVSRGSVLASLRRQQAQFSTDALKAALAEADANVQIATLNEQRLKNLAQRKSISQNDYDVARLELARSEAIAAQARAQWLLQRDRLERHVIAAPFDGRIQRRDIEVGEWLQPGASSFVLADTSSLRIILSIPQLYYGRIQPGSAVDIQFDAHPGTRYSARVSRILPAVQRQGRTFALWVDIPNPDDKLAPGMSLQATLHPPAIADDTAGSDFLIPRDALVRNEQGHTQVWRVNAEQRAEAVPVEVKNAIGAALRVSSKELKASDRLVTRGNENLRANTALEIVSPLPRPDSDTESATTHNADRDK